MQASSLTRNLKLLVVVARLHPPRSLLSGSKDGLLTIVSQLRLCQNIIRCSLRSPCVILILYVILSILNTQNSDIAAHLKLPPVKLHCSMLAEDAIKAAVANYKSKQSKEALWFLSVVPKYRWAFLRFIFFQNKAHFANCIYPINL